MLCTATLTESHWKLVTAVMDAHPTPIPKEEVAARAGYTVKGHINNLLGSLRSLGIVTKKGAVGATELLYPPRQAWRQGRSPYESLGREWTIGLPCNERTTGRPTTRSGNFFGCYRTRRG